MERRPFNELPTLADLRSAAKLVHSVIQPTPQYCWPLMCQRVGTEVWVKHENHTPLGAFKIRGGLVYVDELVAQEPDVAGLLGATRGNHGQSIAYAARRQGLRAVLVVPRGNSPDKNAAMRALGAELVEFGADFSEAFAHARQLAELERLHFVPSFDRGLVRGVASYALELCEAVSDLDAIYVPIGLGSGICGVISVCRALGLQTEVIGVVAEGAPAYALSFAAGRPVASENVLTLADGMACRIPNVEAFEFIHSYASRVVLVSDPEIKDAMRHLFTDTHNVAEGSGAAALAALLKEASSMKGKKVAVILSGGNVDQDVFADALRGQGLAGET